MKGKRRRRGSWGLGVGRCGPAIVALCVSAACGKKGPPLAPLVPIPAAVEVIDASRLGRDVYVSLTVPAANVDEHTPANLARVDIYGYTGRAAPPKARWFELATLVDSIPIAPPPLQPGEKPDAAGAQTSPSEAPVQGTKITVRDTLTPEELVQGKEPPADRETRIADRGPRIPEPPSRIPEPLKRFYAAVPFNDRGRPGPPGGVAEVPLIPLPDPAPSLQAAYSPLGVFLHWEPSGGLIGFLLERAQPEEPPIFIEEEESPASIAVESPGPLGYHVYREILPDPLTPPGPSTDAAWRKQPATPVTPVPLSTLGFTDTVEFGRRRCYTVRAVRGIEPAVRVGEASPETCLTPIDTFPPAPPQSLNTVASEGVVNLIWAPNAEPDLGGYIVLRGEAPGDTLQPLTSRPVVTAGYSDDTVKPGVHYVYAVIAVDNRLPLPNVSVESSRVEETAR